jgi:hypothetical protein
VAYEGMSSFACSDLYVIPHGALILGEAHVWLERGIVADVDVALVDEVGSFPFVDDAFYGPSRG